MAIELTTASPQVLASIRDVLDVPGVSGSQVFSGTVYAENLIYISGNQTISGTKTFDTRPLVNGTGVLLSGEAAQVDLSSTVRTTGDQTISGIKTFVNNQTFSGNINVFGTGILNALDLNNIDNLNFSGVDINIQQATVDLGNSKLLNTIPDIINLNSNFNVTGSQNNRIILVNSSNQITGTIVSGNINGFNASIIQIGNGQVQITGIGNGVTINSFNNQFKTAGRFATISLLHTGNNGYIMYGNTVI